MKQATSRDDIARGSRIAHIRKLHNLRQQDLAEALSGSKDKVTRGAVGNWEIGGDISRVNMQRLADITGASLEWLLTGKGAKPETIQDLASTELAIGKHDVREDVRHNARVVSSAAPYRGGMSNAIPDVDVRAGAGAGGYSIAHEMGRMLTGDEVRGELFLPDYVLDDYTPTRPPYVHAVEVRGDSMEPTLTSGDRVLVDTADKAVGQGGVFVFFDSRHGETNIKRLRRTGNGATMRIEIISDNKLQGAPESVVPVEIMIIGRAVARLTRV